MEGWLGNCGNQQESGASDVERNINGHTHGRSTRYVGLKPRLMIPRSINHHFDEQRGQGGNNKEWEISIDEKCDITKVRTGEWIDEKD